MFSASATPAHLKFLRLYPGFTHRHFPEDAIIEAVKTFIAVLPLASAPVLRVDSSVVQARLSSLLGPEITTTTATADADDS